MLLYIWNAKKYHTNKILTTQYTLHHIPKYQLHLPMINKTKTNCVSLGTTSLILHLWAHRETDSQTLSNIAQSYMKSKPNLNPTPTSSPKLFTHMQFCHNAYYMTQNAYLTTPALAITNICASKTSLPKIQYMSHF